MRVLLKNTWFAPTAIRNLGPLRSTSGRRYRKGEHEMPEELRGFLPPHAEILSDTKHPVVYEEESPDTFSEFNEMRSLDIERAASDDEARIREEADKRRPGRPKKENK